MLVPFAQSTYMPVLSPQRALILTPYLHSCTPLTGTTSLPAGAKLTPQQDKLEEGAKKTTFKETLNFTSLLFLDRMEQ